MTEEVKTKKEQITAVLKNSIAYGVLFIAAGIFFYFLFKNMEETGSGRRINIIFALLYETTGKLGTLIILDSLGLLMLISGIRKILKIKKQ
ncbi:hypothetical protein DMA11_15675 [Marinilabiliaceae bacterium JC017]|nr:hypothetical protein DMA11_15675 [Marinilabiliaceae bacterium JC017]